jgi:ubiquinone/menaquinone biosynthesis C-methylase UbiE
MAASTSRFDRWASSYEDNTLQQYLYVPVHQTALQLAVQLLPHPRRVLDVSCGTGRLLRQARRCYPAAELAGLDLAGQMVASASAVTPARLAVGYVQGRAECLPFPHQVFDLIFTTLSLRHWSDLRPGSHGRHRPRHAPWFQLPDVQAIAAMKGNSRSGPGRRAARDVRSPRPRAT